MTKLRTKVLEVLETNPDWMTVAAIAKKLDSTVLNVHRVLRSDKNVERAILDTAKKNGGRYVHCFRINRQDKNFDSAAQALQLAKEYQGIFGQLHWVKHEKILLGLPKDNHD
jgi:predicted transcriptional regulator